MGDGSPIGGASVSLVGIETADEPTLSDPQTRATSDKDGFFFLRHIPKGATIQIEAKGWALRQVEVDQDVHGKAAAQAIHLDRGRSLTLFFDPDVLPAAAILTAEGYSLFGSNPKTQSLGERATWRCDLRSGNDSSGIHLSRSHCTFRNLPYDVPFRVHAVFANGSVRYEQRPISLKPSDEHLVVGLSYCGRIEGVAKDPSGNALAKHPVWIEWAEGTAKWRLYSTTATAAASAMTDEEGRFAIERLSAGRFWIGIAPTEQVAGKAFQVEVGADPVSVSLQASPSGFITGQVKNADGQNVSLRLMAAKTEVEGEATISGDGAFRIGPLPVGVYQLEELPGSRRTVRTGQPIVWKSRGFGQLEVDAFYPDGSAAVVELLAQYANTVAGVSGEAVRPDSLTLPAQTPIQLYARTEDGHVALVQNIRLQSHQSTKLRVNVRPAARVKVATSRPMHGLDWKFNSQEFFSLEQVDGQYLIPEGPFEVSQWRSGHRVTYRSVAKSGEELSVEWPSNEAQ